MLESYEQYKIVLSIKIIFSDHYLKSFPKYPIISPRVGFFGLSSGWVQFGLVGLGGSWVGFSGVLGQHQGHHRPHQPWPTAQSTTSSQCTRTTHMWVGGWVIWGLFWVAFWGFGFGWLFHWVVVYQWSSGMAAAAAAADVAL